MRANTFKTRSNENFSTHMRRQGVFVDMRDTVHGLSVRCRPGLAAQADSHITPCERGLQATRACALSRQGVCKPSIRMSIRWCWRILEVWTPLSFSSGSKRSTHVKSSLSLPIWAKCGNHSACFAAVHIQRVTVHSVNRLIT
jgi:hypothetical protein